MFPNVATYSSAQADSCYGGLCEQSRTNRQRMAGAQAWQGMHPCRSAYVVLSLRLQAVGGAPDQPSTSSAATLKPPRSVEKAIRHSQLL